MNPDRPPTWSYSEPTPPPICQNCGVPTRIKSKRAPDEFVFFCVMCDTEAKHAIRRPDRGIG
jgi:hypothetical protein